ncbi:MAG TPA: ABC transporter permease [Acidimicrobiia bacterium]|jgi:putative spermidine/putrescine transport system permease protein|nr:ABC transporter permease [Acidimicrobiia bacterium]
MVGDRLRGRRRLQLVLLLAAPLGWLVVAYLGSLGVLIFNALWRFDRGAQVVVKQIGLSNFRELWDSPVYRTITIRTVGVATAVTVSTAMLAFPIAFTMAKLASPRARRLLVIAVLLPLWASYVAKVYAWRTILAEDGILNWLLDPIGLKGPSVTGRSLVGPWLVLTYLWLPYMILPIYAGLERIPDSLIDASSDLGASPFTTFRKVILPLAFPAIVAGSIFTFSLSLGDYITPTLVSSVQFIGNVIYGQLGVGGNLPFAAAYVTVPMVIMVGYLLVARRLGAFENL